MIKDTILQNNLRYHPVRNLSVLVEEKLKKGQQKIYRVSCESNGVDPVNVMLKVEEKYLFVLDGLGADANLFSLLNKAGNLYSDGQYREWETTTGNIKIGDGSGLRMIPQLKSGEYVVTDKRSNSSLGVRLQAKELISATLEHYRDNPPVDPIDGRGDSSYMTDGFWDGLTRIPQETSEEVYRSLPETAQVETTFVFPPQPQEAKIEVVKHYFRTNGEAWNKAPKEVITSLFTRQEIGETLAGKYFDDRES